MSEPTTTPSFSPEDSTASSNLEPAQVDLTSQFDSISELFAGDPLVWNEVDMNRMIAYYREKRKTLDLTESKPKKSAPVKIAPEDLKGISGADLLLKLNLGDI